MLYIFAVPLIMVLSMLYYNKDVLKVAGSWWEVSDGGNGSRGAILSINRKGSMLSSFSAENESDLKFGNPA